MSTLLGWGLLWLGLLLMMKEEPVLVVGWVWFGIGLYALSRYYQKKSGGQLVVGITGLVLGSGTLLWSWEVWRFELWRLWPVGFASIGLGIVASWVLGHTDRWSLLPGGLFLIIGGGGLSAQTWFGWQRWFRRIFDFWPFLLIAIGLIIVKRALKRERTRYP